MTKEFRLVEFPNDEFVIEYSSMTGKAKILRNGIELEQSNEKGKPFIIQQDDTTHLLYIKAGFPDFAPVLEINGRKIEIADKLEWYQYVIGGLPLLLLFVGGLIGGAIGGGLAALNFSIFRSEGNETMKYLKVIGLTILGLVLYLILGVGISSIIGG